MRCASFCGSSRNACCATAQRRPSSTRHRCTSAGVCIEAQDRAGLERSLRYSARPPFALERLCQRGAELVYHCPKPQSGGKQADPGSDQLLGPLELLERIAALVPPPRTHRHLS